MSGTRIAFGIGGRGIDGKEISGAIQTWRPILVARA